MINKHWVGNRLAVSRFMQKNGQDTNVNAFWLDLINTVRLKTPSLFINFMFLNYFSKKINNIPKTDYLMVSSKFSINLKSQRLMLNANNFNLSNATLINQVAKDKHDFELILGAKALLNFKMLDMAVDFFNKNRIKLSAVNLRHYFYSVQILDSLKPQRHINILEIGGGGQFVYNPRFTDAGEN